MAQSASAADAKAATIIRNARVFVGDNANTMADAVAIGADGRILAVGTDKQVGAYSAYSTEVVDAKGGTVMSGIHDGHVHPMYAGLRALNPSLEDAELTAAEVQDIVTTFLADPAFGSEPDSWLSVEAWNPAGTPSDTLPHKDILDSLATSRPIALSGSDGHNIWVNSKALQIAGIDSNTPDPTDGEIVRDNNGDPTGVLKDGAQGLVTQYIPGPSPEEMYDAFVSAFAQMAAGGITTILDAWVAPWQLDFYAEMAAERAPAHPHIPGDVGRHQQGQAPAAVPQEGAGARRRIQRRAEPPLRQHQGLHGRRHRVPRADRGTDQAVPRCGRQPHRQLR